MLASHPRIYSVGSTSLSEFPTPSRMDSRYLRGKLSNYPKHGYDLELFVRDLLSREERSILRNNKEIDALPS